MPELQQFLSAIANAPDARSLAPAGQQRHVTARTGWRSRLVERFQTRDNQDVALQFIAALRATYGSESAETVAESAGLYRVIARHKPLRVRHVRTAIESADLWAAATKSANTRLAESYSSNLQGGLTVAMQRFRRLIQDVVYQKYGGHESIAQLVDYRRLAASVADAIQADGIDGETVTRTINQRRADEICKCIVDEHLFAAARKRALEKLDPSRPGSIGYNELATAVSKLDPPLTLKHGSLSPDAIEALYRMFARAIDSGTIRAEDLVDEASLRELAGDTVRAFMAEREASRARVSQIEQIDEQERRALLEQVTFDTIPENLVEPLGRAYILLRARLARMNQDSPPAALQQSVKEICFAIETIRQDHRFGLDSDNGDLAYRHAWRFLLAPGGNAQASKILGQMALQRSPLRNNCEAALWYANEFKNTSEATRTLREHQGTPNVKIHDDQSFETASRYGKTLLWLAAVAAEKTGPDADWGNTFVANPNPTDETVATLRDLGIPFPAPDRLDRANDNVSLSRPSLAKIQEAIDRKVADTPDLHKWGLTKDCVLFLRQNERTQQRKEFKAYFSVDGEDLPRPTEARTVAKSLRNFCKDAHGNLNKELLASVSRMVNHHTFDCLYSGCMNPLRPDLSIMNGYPRGVMGGHSYSLWKDGNGETRLMVGEIITPLKLYPMGPDAGRMTAEGQPDEAALEWQRLSGRNSGFRIRATIRFNPENYRPEIETVGVTYRLVSGGDNPLVDDPGYWVETRGASEEPQDSADSHSATPMEGDVAGLRQHSDSFEVEVRPDLDPLYSTIRLHRLQTPHQSQATGE